MILSECSWLGSLPCKRDCQYRAVMVWEASDGRGLDLISGLPL